MSGAAGARLGVDLGTTWTAAALERDDRIDALSLGTNTAVMPSVVARVGDELVVGETAEHHLLEDPASGAREFKRRLGDTTPIVIAGAPYGAEALTGQLLRHVIGEATTASGAAPAEVVCTHPANWSEYKLDLLREAARLAGLGTVTLMPEPVAAALHYVRLGRLSQGDTVAVYDFGGGTFDAAVVQCTDQGASLLGPPEGLERLGGVDLDQIVVARVDQALDGRLRELDSSDPEVRRALVRLRAECTLAKEALTNDTEAAISVTVPGLQTQVRVTREEFESEVRARVTDTLNALDRALANAHVENTALAGVLLAGGTSRIPVVGEAVARHTGRPNLVDADPKLVVALGAAGGSTVMATSDTGAPEDDVRDAIDEHDGTGDNAAASDGSHPASPAAKAAATAAALHAAADAKDPKQKGRREGGGVSRGLVAGVGAAAAGAAAVGYTAMGGSWTGTPRGHHAPDHQQADHHAADASTNAPTAPPAPNGPPPDHSMDAFDHLAGGGGGGRGGAPHMSFGAPRGGGGNVGGGGGGGGGNGGGGGGGLATMPDISAARAELLNRLDQWQPPAGADPAAVAEFRTQLHGIVDRFQGAPGESQNNALASLRQEFDDHVQAFVQEQKIDVLVGEHTPSPQPGFDWVAGHYDTGGDWLPGHWERAPAGGGAIDTGTGTGSASQGTWVDGHYDDHGHYVAGHWDGPAPPSGEPPAMHMPGWSPDGPGVPGTPSNPFPGGNGPVIVRDHYPGGAYGGGGGDVVVRDHRGAPGATNGSGQPQQGYGTPSGGQRGGAGPGSSRGGQQGTGSGQPGNHGGGNQGSNQHGSNDNGDHGDNTDNGDNSDGNGSDDTGGGAYDDTGGGAYGDDGGFDNGGGFDSGGFDDGGGGFDSGGFDSGGFDGGGGFDSFAATVPAEDPLGVDAFATASATAPAMDLGGDPTVMTTPTPGPAVMAAPEPAPMPDPVPALVAAAPDPAPSPLDAPGPLDAPIDVAPVGLDDGGSGGAGGGGDAGPPPDDDTPSDLDNNPHTPQ